MKIIKSFRLVESFCFIELNDNDEKLIINGGGKCNY